MAAVIITASCLLLAALAIALFSYSTTFLRSKRSVINQSTLNTIKVYNGADFLDREDRQTLELLSYDGLRLRGYFFDRGADTTIIFCHGYKSSLQRMSALISDMYDCGYNALVLSLRAHGISEGKAFSMGFKEGRDLIAWTGKLNELKPQGKIVLYGWSMGGSTVLNAVCGELPENVICAVTDCAYENLYDQLVHSSRLFMPWLPFPELAASLLDVYCRLFHGFKLRSPMSRSLGKCRIPMMFIHGEEDGFVPFENLDRLYNACSSKKLRCAYPGAAHISSHHSDRERYVRELDGFIKAAPHNTSAASVG